MSRPTFSIHFAAERRQWFQATLFGSAPGAEPRVIFVRAITSDEAEQLAERIVPHALSVMVEEPHFVPLARVRLRDGVFFLEGLS